MQLHSARAEPLWDALAPASERARQLLAEAHLAVHRGDLRGAEAALRRAIECAPDDPAPLVALADVHRRRGDWAAARVELEQAAPLAERQGRPDPALSVALGLARAATSDLAGSIAAYHRAEAEGGLSSTNAWQLPFDLGDSLMALGRLDDAIASYRRALTDGGSSRAIVHFALGVALDRAGLVAESRAEIALGRFHDPGLRNFDPDENLFVPSSERPYYLALAQLQRGQLASARAGFAQFVAAAPDGPYAPRARDHLAELGDRVDAREITGATVDRAALARALTDAHPALLRCLKPAPGPTLLSVRLSRAAALVPDTTSAEELCVGDATSAARRLLPEGASAIFPLARPLPDP